MENLIKYDDKQTYAQGIELIRNIFKTEPKNGNGLFEDFVNQEIQFQLYLAIQDSSYSLDKSVNVKEMKEKFKHFLTKNEAELTFQQLTLFVNILEDAQELCNTEQQNSQEAHKNKKKNNFRSVRLINMAETNPPLLDALRAKTQKVIDKKNERESLKRSVMPENYQHLNLNTRINKPKDEIQNNINRINYSIDDKEYEQEDKKEEPKDSINENLNIEREKFKKIDVKNASHKNYRESNISDKDPRRESSIIDSDNDLKEIHSKTVIISSNSKYNDDEFNPKTTMIKKKKVNKANQSMMLPKTNKIEDKKAESKTEVKFSKINVNNKKNQIHKK